MVNYSFTVENHGMHSFLVYCVKPDDHLDSTSLGMLTNNKIPGLAATLYTQMDTTKYIKYNISGKVPVKQFLARKTNKRRLTTMFSGIVNAMMSTEEYMLDMDSILLDVDYIFTDASTYETVVICLPINNLQKNQVDLRDFFKGIMMNVQYDSTEDFSYFAKIVNYLNSTPVFSLEVFHALLSEIKNEVKINKTEVKREQENYGSYINKISDEQEVNGPKRNINKFISSPFSQSVEVEEEKAELADEKQISLFYLLQHYNKENAALYKAQTAARKKAKKTDKAKDKKKETTKKDKNTDEFNMDLDFAIPGQVSSYEMISPLQQPVSVQTKKQPKLEVVQQKEITPRAVSREMDFGSTVILDDDNDDTLYIEQEETLIRPYLIRQKTGDRIDIDRAMFRIGRSKNETDYQISDNQAIGRKHAYIEYLNNEYFIVDMKSKNYTFVNGMKIQENIEVKLSHGDIVRLANEEFQFFISE